MAVKITDKQKQLMKKMAEQNIRKTDSAYNSSVVYRTSGFSHKYNRFTGNEIRPKFSAKDFINNSAAEIIYPI